MSPFLQTIHHHLMAWLLVLPPFLSPSPLSAGEKPLGQGDKIDESFYRDRVRPLLDLKCIACHGPLRSEAGLRLDAAERIHRGSDEGAVIDIANPAKSKLIQRVQSTESDSRMPPVDEGAPLTEAEIGDILRWIDAGMPSPKNEEVLNGPSDHWAYRPIERPSSEFAAGSSPIDQLLLAKQKQYHLQPLPEADRYTLLRRITFDLTGLPPTRREIDTFLSDTRADFYEKRVDELLSRPSYGERWGRHWMDVWRYSDWDGYKEELRGSQRNIWHWRDWIIESLNENKPYDRMIHEMLAGDELDPLNESTLRATGFLARNFHRSNRNIWLDATVEHTAKAFLGLTVNCAKCHDHKYDPISQKDYYRFRAIFEPHQVRTEGSASIHGKSLPGVPRAYDADLQAPTYLFVRGDDKKPLKEAPIPYGIPSMLPVLGPIEAQAVSMPKEAYLPELTPKAEKEALLKAWNRFDEARKQLDLASSKSKENDLSEHPDGSLEDVALRVLQVREAEAFVTSLKARYAADKAKHIERDHDQEKRLSEVALSTEQKWNVLAAELKVLERKQALQAAENSNPKDQKKKAAAIEKAKKELAAAEESLKKLNTDPNAPIKQYTPVTKAYPSESSGRRLALARWITHPQNPLTARVAVNHIWTRHFGTPLVENVFDLGMKSPKPELLSLLDWLAAELVANGWDMKHLHRLIVASDAYKRASSGTPEQVAHERAKDADNRFYWRFPTRRLDAEEVRDNLLSVSHLLDASMGGPDLSEDDGEKSYRRSVYFRHAYEKQMTMLVLFDAASPNECYRRKPSIIPQQALVIANSPLARSASRSLGSRLWKDANQDAVLFVERLFLEVLGRPASQWERNKSMDYLEQYQQGNLPDSPLPIESNAASSNEKMPDAAPVDRWEKACQSLAHVLINHNDFVNIR